MRLNRPCAILLVLLCCASALAGRGPLTTAEWLMDLARDQALQLRDDPKTGDPREVEALLRAAVRIDPSLAEAYALLYEYAVLSGDPDAAAAHLEALVRCDPQHLGAFGRYLDQKVASYQTVEARSAWLESQLKTPDLSAERSALILERLAVLALQRMDRRQARQYAERSLAADPLLPDAALLVFHTLPDESSPEDRLRSALTALRLNTTNTELCWQTGMLITDSGLTAEAEPYFDRAVSLHRAASPGAMPPVNCLVKLGLAQWAADHRDEAIKTIQEAATRRDDPSAIEANLLVCWMLREQKRVGESEVVRHKLAEQFAQVRDPSTAPIGDVAQAAWFHCTLDPLPQRALSLAEAAAARAATDEFVQRVLGWALWLNSRTEDALEKLKPLATHDPFAAFVVARIQLDAGNQSEATHTLDGIEVPPQSGPAGGLLASLRESLGVPATQPATAKQREFREILAAFDLSPLKFETNADQALEVSIDLDEKNLNPGQPWRATFTLRNRATYPITLGEDGMVNPAFLLSFRVDGDRPRDYGELMTVTLDQRRTLRPGEKLQVRRTLDVGPVRRQSRMAPQQLLRIQLDAIFDPRRTADGTWEPSSTGRRLRTVYFNRLPANVSREGQNALFASLSGPNNPGRFETVELMGELLGESQRAALGLLKYAPEPVPGERLLHAIHAALTSESWELRARTLEALQVAGLDAQTLRLATVCCTHENWVVRMMAARLVARNGAAAREELMARAGDEADELVRTILRCKIEQIDRVAATEKTATTNPSRGGEIEK